jgi:hypothetical protein
VKEVLDIYGGGVPALYVMDPASSSEKTSKDSDSGSDF